MVEPRGWRWSLFDDDVVLGDALMMHYVFTVFIDACGWIPCYTMPWGHDGNDMIHSCEKMTYIDVML